MTHYILEMKEKSELKFKVKQPRVTGTSCDVTDLVEGVAYEFKVTAVNKAGQGMPSGASEVVKYGVQTFYTSIHFTCIYFCEIQ